MSAPPPDPGPWSAGRPMPPPDPAADRAALEEALDELHAWIRKGKAPARQDARAVLIPLGRLALADPDTDLGPESPLVTRLREAVAPCAEVWEGVVTEELALACAEHVQGVDPRYLELENYDLDYTLAARERLEARLAGAGVLGVEAPEHLLEGVRRADGLLRPLLEARNRPPRA